MNTGNWNIDANVNGMPQKIATAFDKVSEALMGAAYEFIAYLGSQVVNGTNHAVLAKQIVTTGRDSENIVVMIFNEKVNEAEAALIGIERVIESGMELGGTEIHVDNVLDLESKEMKIWHDAFDGYVGISVRPFSYLGSQVVNGTNYIYAATMEPMTLEGVKMAGLVTINPTAQKVTMIDMLTNKQEASLNYAFNW